MWVVKVYYGNMPEANWSPKKILCNVMHYKKLKYALCDVTNPNSDIYDNLPEELSVEHKKCEMKSFSDGDDYMFKYENGVTVYLEIPFVEDDV